MKFHSKIPSATFLLLLSLSIVVAGCATDKARVSLVKHVGGQNGENAPDPEGYSTCSSDPLVTTYSNMTPQERAQQEILDSALEYCQSANDYRERGDIENTINALDQAYSLILSINSDEAPPRILQQKEDLRFTISKRIAEAYASRFTVVNGQHKAIPLDMNCHVKKALDMFKGPLRDFFLSAYYRSGRYRPAIVSALKEAGLPEELSWLPLIESGFKTKALSRARALGMWQFIASTGYKFGLKRDTWVDERMDVEKSTSAAISYLKELHQLFGDWTTVLAAYNCGEGAVLRKIRTQNINYLDNFWDLYEKLPAETAFYVPQFLAVLHIVNDPQAHGFSSLPLDKPLEFDKIRINRQVNLDALSEHLGLSPYVLRQLNPALRYHCTPDGPYYDFKAPKGTGDTILVKIAEVPEWKPSVYVKESQKRRNMARQTISKPAPEFATHVVRKGETLSSIAKKYGTTVSAIASINYLSIKKSISAGRRLKIPVSGSTYAGNTKTTQSSISFPQKATKKYIVARGDTLAKIAARFETTTGAIMSLNKIKSLKAGQTLIIPSSATKAEAATLKTKIASSKTKPSSPTKAGKAASPMKTKSYKVAKGDSVCKIADKHRMDVAELLKINDLTSKSKLYPGQTLIVKVN
ncbi:Lytic transglycosylase catalytic [uncultured Desulfobacterium sp.]|uniref:Lytic transglycosylase catalytic n=1 Tax=uncultured Desulfobacterium sp. TaxID=201089 RepID=A0A445MZF3_9BACT|nr:Lytic transglycosylase catalytic [uncultured Desulfobacterium sp.]